MVVADTFAGKNIHDIIINLFGHPREMAQTAGVDNYPGLGMTWVTGGYDLDPAEDNDADWAGILGALGDQDLDTVYADNHACFVVPPMCTAWAQYVTSGGALIKGDLLGVSGATDGNMAKLTGAGILPRGRFEVCPNGDIYKADIAAMNIIGITVLFGGTVALA